jgi:LPPG:FO 2-phospho-L-lactate transferase
VGGLYGGRAEGGLLDWWMVDTSDAGCAVDAVRVLAIPLWMSEERATGHMVAAAIAAAQSARTTHG